MFALNSLPEEPWRNGGGRTRTIATGMRESPSVATDHEPPWDWRISVATIERSGPFSAFPGVDRRSMLLGAGAIELSAIGEPTLQMQSPGDVVAYRGDAVWTATLLCDGPPLSFLNVMTHRGAARARMKASRDRALLTGHALAVLVIEGHWRLIDTTAESGPGQGSTLEPGAGVLSGAPPSLSPSTLCWRVERMSTTGMLSIIEIDCDERR